MTSRQKRFQREQAEEVKLVLTGHVRCPRCKKLTKKDELKTSFWDPSSPPVCLACRNDLEIEFIESVSKDMAGDVKNGISTITKAIFGGKK
ncbi:hypothetical protein KAR91_18955 [Candidatus Pacearchaeota archaeon]|nr:hypothetical protein [Candidatus Pacearchaeota archaeon]